MSGELRVNQLARAHATLRQALDGQLVTIDRLKRGPRAWRTKSQLEERLAEAHETGERIKAIDGQLRAARSALVAARSTLVAAIDDELARGVAGSRAQELTALRAQQQPRREARRIVLPDTRIDPRLDPEELDEQVAAIREGEAALDRQIKGLEDQGKELQRVAELRKHNDRTLELDKRDDNASRRAASREPSEVISDSGSPSGPLYGGADRHLVESEAPIVLPEVVEQTILDGIVKAQRSGDPAQRAIAVKKARDAVAAKREQLRQQRLQIEKLARDRRMQR